MGNIGPLNIDNSKMVNTKTGTPGTNPFKAVYNAIATPGVVKNNSIQNTGGDATASFNFGGTPSTTTTTQNNNTGGTNNNTVVDPYAAWGGKAMYDYYQGAKNTAFNSITDAENNNAGTYHGSILDYLDGAKMGQGKIDTSTINNELAKKQGSDSILKMVGQGVRSSGIRLAGGNASSSSAAEQLAKAWGENGRDMESNVNNQYELGANNIANDQSNFDITDAANLRHLGENKSTIVNSIIDDATNKIGQLNSQAAYSNLPDQIDIEGEKTRIRNETMAKLTAFDQELHDKRSAIAPISHDDALGKAFNLAEAGKASTTPFDIPSVVPVNTTGAAAGAGPLPYYPPVAKKDSIA